MNKAFLSLCLFGAAIATANTIFFHPATCSSRGLAVTTTSKDASSTLPPAFSIAQDQPLPARTSSPKDEAVSAALGSAPKAAARKPALPTDEAVSLGQGPAQNPPASKDLTGSVTQSAKTQTRSGDDRASKSQAKLAEVGTPPAKLDDEPEEWAEVALAAKVHNAPSVSSPTVRYYRVGTRLKVVGRESGWIKIVDPATSKDGWIFEKYLTPKEGPDQKKSAQAAANEPDDSHVSALPPPGPYARPYRLRKYGWKRYRYPPIGFAIGVYPRW